MNTPEPTIRVNVDPTNPGHFFACCGLLELADRLWPAAEVTGDFSPPRFDRSLFKLSSGQSLCLNRILRNLLSCTRMAVDPYQPIRGSDGKPVKDAQKTKPVVLRCNDDSGCELFSLRLAWWLDELAGTQTRFKTWSAHNTAEGLIASLSDQIKADEIEEKNLLQHCVGMTSRLGLDPRSSWNTLDTGFSPNDQKLPVDTYAATELLAAIGLETFRPTSSDDSHVYAVWSNPLPVTVARAAASGKLEIQGITRYSFEVTSRGKFKYFTKASLLERSNHA